MTSGFKHIANSQAKPHPTVALVSDAILPYHFGGKENYYHELARRLTASMDVEIFTMHWWDGASVQNVDGIKHIGICPRTPLYTKSGRRSVWQALIFAASCFRLLWYRFDVILADHIPYLQLLALRVVATLKRRRLIIVWHEVWGREYWVRYAGMIGYIGNWIESLCMRLPDHIISSSAHTADRLRPLLKANMPLTVATTGIDLDFISHIPADEQKYDLITVGRLVDHKKMDMLLEALSLLHKNGCKATLCIVGDGPERSALHEKAAGLFLQDSVRFRHDVGTQAEVYSLMKAARVFVFPSARDGFGIAVLEAFACGIPVVTTSAPDNLARYLVLRSKKGLICEPTASGLSEALENMLNTVSNGSTNTLPQEKWLNEFDWKTNANIVAAILTQRSSQ